MDLQLGQRAKVADLVPNGQRFTLEVAIEAPRMVLDFACFGLDATGQLADERYMVFFNQPRSPCGGVALTTNQASGHGGGNAASFAIALDQLPASIERLTLTAALDGAGAMSRIGRGQVRVLDGGQERACFAFSGADFSAERALMLLEFYRKNGVWRAGALGQGFNGGLAALVEHFGGSVAAETPAAKPPQASEPAPIPRAPSSSAPPATPAVNLSKITLEKTGSTVSLEKQDNANFGEILINLKWRPVAAGAQKKGFFGSLMGGGKTDLDVGCLFEMNNSLKSAVQALGDTFGNYHQPPYIKLDADDRTGSSSEGENLRINGQYWSHLRRVLIYAFIYEGAPNWAEADAVIHIRTPGQPEIEVRLDSHRNDRPMCAIALLENHNGAVKITKRVEYFRGHKDMDEAYHWGLDWVRGRKD
ncbi:TerD family protein [Rhabdochromatium marinum]|uniref:TerD family protein n=1 Tax=Rhabdochromatium marinum TaxID=48729 RepID=UPI001904A22B|nr:TerD family protein [Rhabdochromatium marinum]MBK1648956.1 tellurium resistance protein [Rhabdochromatium marinum]